MTDSVIRRRRLGDVLLIINTAQLVRPYKLWSLRLWPWKMVYQRAAQALFDENWVPIRKSSAESNSEFQADIRILSVPVAELDEIKRIIEGGD